MAQSSISLTWELHRNNICDGLSSLQQNGEFVDMTLAADGHHVKVHQIVMALASPYIKELIRSAACPHPVVFLNKISYTTLSAILEYIYTGEVLVSVENIPQLIQAARELHIKGLEDMNLQKSVGKPPTQEVEMLEEDNTDTLEDEICYFEVPPPPPTFTVSTPKRKAQFALLDEGIPDDSHSLDATEYENNDETLIEEQSPEKKPRIASSNQNKILQNTLDKDGTAPPVNIMQYTVSNQGSLQMILNRYMYYLKHSNRNNSRQWRCVDYLNTWKCPAIVFTKEDVVIQRTSAHTHPFHDKRILKKVRAGAVFTAIQEAENQGKDIKIKSKDKSDVQT